jgi:uncharacterized membrane-anchored protein
MITRNTQAIWLAMLALFCLPLHAQETAPTKAQQQLEAAYAAANAVLQQGPVTVGILDQAEIKVPAGFSFVPKAESMQLLAAMGNGTNPEVEGMLFPTSDENNGWFVVVSYENTGFIKDDDAKEWNTSEMLNSIIEGTEAGNAERREMGIAEMEVRGWAEVPKYDVSTHRLVWSLKSVDKGADNELDAGVNYNTVLLGREGRISLNMVASLADLPALKPVANNLLAQLEFKAGRAYSDFDASTDKVAEYGLAALVVGAAAKKLGLFAVIAAFFLKFIKIFAVAGAGLFYGVRKYFSSKKATASTSE